MGITKRKQNRRRMPLRWQIICYFVTFVFVLMLVLWLSQTVFVDRFYQRVRMNELDRASDTIVSALDSDSLAAITENIAASKQICVLLYDGNGNILLSYDIAPDCIIHRASPETISGYYRQALDAGGKAVTRITRDSFRTVDADGKQLGSPPDATIVLTRIAENADGEVRVLFLNTVIAPLAATVRTLKMQILMISVVLVPLAFLLAVLMARNVSRPIDKLNRSSQALAKGQYEADFSVSSGCREVVELSDTLSHAASEISKADRMQKELIANISHDLRTPLTLIKGYGEVMRDIPGEMSAENMQVIIDETERLSSLVTDLVDVSRMSAGVPILNLSAFDLGDAVRETVNRYQKLIENDAYQMTCSCTDRLPVSADYVRILQVVYNLINNAINYTGEDKRIAVRAFRNGDAARFEVSDTGNGIPEDQLPLIWDRYYKVDRVHQRAAVGSGLGLSIVKNILNLHHAKFGVESVVGSGSTFWFELPLRDDGSEAL